MSMRKVSATAMGACLALAVLASCAKKEDAPPPAAAAPAPASVATTTISADASILDLMKGPIATNSDALWNAVGTESTATGTKDLAPSSDAEWAALRQKAQELIDAAKALTTEGRVVAHPGQTLKEPAGKGDFTPEQAQVEISKDRGAFTAFATAMQGVGGEYIAAIDKKDVDAIGEAGGKLDEVCEACHTRFWYPNAPKPPGL